MKSSKGPHPLKKTVNVIDTVLFVLAAAGTLFMAYAGRIDPRHVPIAGIAAMGFPAGILLMFVWLVVELVCRRFRRAGITVLVLTVCLPAILTYSPVNLHRRVTAPTDKQDDTFTLMTFNVIWWWDAADPKKVMMRNPDVDLIIRTNPDIICLQEAHPIKPNWRLGITDGMADTINARYPYRISELPNTLRGGLTLYSKFPVQKIVDEDYLNGTGNFACYRLIINNQLMTLYNIHLQSLGLTSEDKKIYEDITRGDGGLGEIRAAQKQIFGKLYNAYGHRANQADSLLSLVNRKTDNVIVCGDFNDIPGCWAINRIRQAGLKDAFADAGIGPSITYHFNHMYFRIDHVLYRGDFRAVDARVLRQGSSDHYPLLVTFRYR